MVGAHHTDSVGAQLTLVVAHKGRAVEERRAGLEAVVCSRLWEAEARQREEAHGQLEVEGLRLHVEGGSQLTQREEVASHLLARAFGHKRVGFESEENWAKGL